MGNSDTTVALTGNSYFAQSLRKLQNPRFLETVDYLRSNDVVLTNLECTIPKPDTPPAFVAGSGWGATYMAGKPDMVEDLKYIGVDAVCAANNHVNDFGDQGILDTIDCLQEKAMPYAGIGASLAQATQPCYIDARTGLKVAVIVACDWGPRGSQRLNFPWPVGFMPSDDAAPFTSRPGVNLLRYEAVTHVSAEQLEALRQISQDLEWEKDLVYKFRSYPLVGMNTNLGIEDTDTEHWFLGRKFVADSKPGYHTVANEQDLERMFKHIREARRQADIVCVGLHDQSHGEHVHDYISTFAHGAIDNGADMYFNNGGAMMGIEMYKGKPIFYGIPAFFLQTEAVLNVPSSEMSRYQLPADATASDFLEARNVVAQKARKVAGVGKMMHGAGGSAVHVCVYDDHGELKEIQIQPLEPLGGTIMESTDKAIPRYRRQLPLFPEAGNPIAKGVLEHAVETSAELGTEVEIKDGLGIVHVK